MKEERSYDMMIQKRGALFYFCPIYFFPLLDTSDALVTSWPFSFVGIEVAEWCDNQQVMIVRQKEPFTLNVRFDLSIGWVYMWIYNIQICH